MRYLCEICGLAAHGLVRDRDPPLGEQVLGVTKAECEPEIEPNRLMYDLGREPISGLADFPHPLGYCAYMHPTRCRRRDKALQSLPTRRMQKLLCRRTLWIQMNLPRSRNDLRQHSTRMISWRVRRNVLGRPPGRFERSNEGVAAPSPSGEVFGAQYARSIAKQVNLPDTEL